MPTFLYTRPSDNLIPRATLTVNVGTEDPIYPIRFLGDLHPERPAKLLETSGAIVADLTTAQAPELVALIHHNFDYGLDVRLQGNSSNSWGSPPVNLSFTIPERYFDFFTVNVWLDVKTLIPNAGSRTYRYWRLAILTANSQPIQVGQWVLSLYRRDLGVRNIAWGSQRSWERPAILHATELLCRRAYDLGTTVRTVRVNVEPTDATLNQIDTWYRDSAGILRPFVIVPYGGPAAVTPSEIDAWYVGWTNPTQPYTRARRDYNTLSLEFQELSRGLFP